MSSGETSPRRIVAAPLPTHPGLRAQLLDVECAEDEEIIWVWSDTGTGSAVTGYHVVPRGSRW